MNADEYPLELLRVRRLWLFTPLPQIGTVTLLYVLTTLVFARDFARHGTMLGGSPEVWILFVPVTEAPSRSAQSPRPSRSVCERSGPA